MRSIVKYRGMRLVEESRSSADPLRPLKLKEEAERLERSKLKEGAERLKSKEEEERLKLREEAERLRLKEAAERQERIRAKLQKKREAPQDCPMPAQFHTLSVINRRSGLGFCWVG